MQTGDATPNIRASVRRVRSRTRGIACNFTNHVRRSASPDPSPRAILSEKHDLTPQSKSMGLPRTKRSHLGGEYTSRFMKFFQKLDKPNVLK